MYKLFFNRNGEQKKWIVLTNIFLPLFFTLWGIILSIKSYNLSVDTSNNREQIDSMKVMINEIREQNKLLVVQIDKLSQLVNVGKENSLTQNKQLDILNNEAKYARRPKLVFDDMGSIEPNNLTLYIKNIGEDIYDFKMQPTNDIKIIIPFLPKKGIITNNASFEIQFHNLSKDLYRIRFYFKDNLMNKYYQDAVLYKKDGNYEYKFDPLTSI